MCVSRQHEIWADQGSVEDLDEEKLTSRSSTVRDYCPFARLESRQHCADGSNSAGQLRTRRDFISVGSCLHLGDRRRHQPAADRFHEVSPAPGAVRDAKVERQAPGCLPTTNDVIDRGCSPDALRDVVCRTKRQNRKRSPAACEHTRGTSNCAVASRRDNEVGERLEQSLQTSRLLDDSDQLVATPLNHVADMVERDAVASVLVVEERDPHARTVSKNCADFSTGRPFA